MKVQISHQSGKKYPHDLCHDINTTTSFGFCQPILSRQLNAQDTVSLRFGQICRLNPLAKPTFGQMKLKTYTSFVKAEDIWHAYGSFLAGQTYGGAVNSYIPTYLPATSCRSLYFLCMLNSQITVLSGTFTNYESGGINLADVRQVTDSAIIDEVRLTFGEIYGGFTKTDDVSNFYNTYETVFLSRFGGKFGRAELLLYGASVPVDISKGLTNFDWYVDFTVRSGGRYLICGRFNNVARNLRKVFIGNGYQLNFDTTRVDILPLFANYKAYFDIFVPQRNITWKDTSAFKLMEFAEQSGLNDFRDLSNLVTDGHAMDFCNFILDLATMYYTIPGDYASAHILGLGNDVVPSSSVTYLNNNGDDGIISNDELSKGAAAFEGLNNSMLNRSALRILNEMQKLSNLHSAVGGNIREYLRAVYNSDYNDDVDSAFIGSQILDISPEPVFNTAETSEASLGEFGGQALGSTPGKNLKFTAKSPGYLISFFCAVPDARMSQGVDPILYHSVKEDVYNSRYDALTLLPTRKTAIYGTEEISVGSVTNRSLYTGGFGNIPNFSEYKIKHNILNGDMSLPSTRASYLPFTLDKLLPYRKVDFNGTTNRLQILPGVTASALVAGVFWRYVGLYRWFGNFDRIFVYDEFRESSDAPIFDLLKSFDDNFIIQMYADFKVTGYELPLARSFDTGEMDGDVMTVEKS